MAVSLAAAPESWAAKQNATLLTDHMLRCWMWARRRCNWR